MTKLAIARATILLLFSVTVSVADPSPDQNVKGLSLKAGTRLLGTGRATVLKAQPATHAVITFPTGKQ